MSSAATMSVEARTEELLENINPQIRIIACVGPSASGKTRLINTLLEREPRLLRMKSVTTRERRDTDPEGEYEYLTSERFQRRSHNGAFEWIAGIHGNQYGTLKSSLAGALQTTVPSVMHLRPDSVPQLLAVAGPVVRLIYVVVPLEDLERRLRERDDDKTEAYYFERIQSCRQWEEAARQSGYPYHFVSNPDGDFEEAFVQLVSYLMH